MIKVCTTKKNGKFVSYLSLCLLVCSLFSSCELQEDPVIDDVRDYITGSWKCQEIDQNNKTINFVAGISKSSMDTSHVWIDNFSALGSGVKVTVSMDGFLLTISKQTVDGTQITGSGAISSSYDRIEWTYSLDDGGGKEYFTATYSR